MASPRHRRRRSGAATVALLVGPAVAQEHDLVLRNGRVVDGTGAPRFRADVATGMRPGRVLRGPAVRTPSGGSP